VNKKFALVSLLILVAMVFTACGGGGATTGLTLNGNLSTEPPTADPDLSQDTTSIQVVELAFLGLTNQNVTTLAAEPELATSWENSTDGLTWTFHMRKDVNWVSYDPATQKATKQRPVTAYDVEYSTKRPSTL
jgi:oligopeptide transport system substrate-binding protein